MATAISDISVDYFSSIRVYYFCMCRLLKYVNCVYYFSIIRVYYCSSIRVYYCTIIILYITQISVYCYHSYYYFVYNYNSVYISVFYFTTMSKYFMCTVCDRSPKEVGSQKVATNKQQTDFLAPFILATFSQPYRILYMEQKSVDPSLVCNFVPFPPILLYDTVLLSV